MTAIATWQEDGSLHLRTPYDADFIADFKANLNYRDREWLPEMKVWHVSARAARDAIALARSWFDVVQEVPFRRAASGAGASLARGPHADLHVLESAPWPVVEAAYKALARLNHPDRGGSTAAMQKINAAFAQLKEHQP